MKCRFCNAHVTTTFLDLGMQPLSNAFVPLARAEEEELTFPLHVRVCDECLLVQLPVYAAREAIFQDYPYLSSMSASWVEHARTYAVDVIERFRLSETSFVVELASNDGYLLKHFVERAIPSLGIEPAANVADIASRAGVPTLPEFFGESLARSLVESRGHASLVVANNVLAHVPDVNDFVEGVRLLIGEDGVATFEFPHLARLLEHTQYDTVYHEHFSYFSLFTASRILAAHGLEVFDVQPLETHGGSLRLFAHRAGAPRAVSRSVASALRDEERDGACSLARYARFPSEVAASKRALLSLLLEEKRQGHRVVAYGAAAKGNTLLNYAGIKGDLVDFAVDKSPLKQGTLMPGSRLHVHEPDRIARTKPDVVLILPWNLEREITHQLAFVREWGGRFAVPVPTAHFV